MTRKLPTEKSLAEYAIARGKMDAITQGYQQWNKETGWPDRSADELVFEFGQEMTEKEDQFVMAFIEYFEELQEIMNITKPGPLTYEEWRASSKFYLDLDEVNDAFKGSVGYGFTDGSVIYCYKLAQIKSIDQQTHMYGVTIGNDDQAFTNFETACKHLWDNHAKGNQ